MDESVTAYGASRECEVVSCTCEICSCQFDGSLKFTVDGKHEIRSAGAYDVLCRECWRKEVARIEKPKMDRLKEEARLADERSRLRGIVSPDKDWYPRCKTCMFWHEQSSSCLEITVDRVNDIAYTSDPEHSSDLVVAETFGCVLHKPHGAGDE